MRAVVILRPLRGEEPAIRLEVPLHPSGSTRPAVAPGGAIPPAQYRLYRDLAAWWPLISPPDEYAAEAGFLGRLLGSVQAPVREVLDLGSGGGHIATHLKGWLSLTLVDISADMLTVSRALNPECAHVQGDMRTIRLGRRFDAVLLHDAVDYVTTRADLRRVITTAYAHCRPGGFAVFVPDYTADTFSPGTGRGGGSDGNGRRASFTERTWDPDPSDDWIQADYEFVLQAADGAVMVVREQHRLGAFRQATWLRLLTSAGFEAEEPGAKAAADGGVPPRHLFTGRRPPGATAAR
jgi:SAM-dependent methyltransferase